jgi:hypothetical protein
MTGFATGVEIETVIGVETETETASNGTAATALGGAPLRKQRGTDRVPLFI